MTRLIALDHKIIRDALSIKPAIPRLAHWRDNSSATNRDDINTLHVIRQRNSLWQAYGLTAIALENSTLIHN